MKNFATLYNFLDRAIKNRNYPQNTALGLRAALNLFKNELNEDELNSLDVFKSHIDVITQTVFSKNKKLNSRSLEEYKSRVKKVLRDYEEYGVDNAKMSNWIPKSRSTTARKRAPTSSVIEMKSGESQNHTPFISHTNMHRIDLALRGADTKFTLIIPHDIKKTECETLKNILDSLCREEKNNHV